MFICFGQPVTVIGKKSVVADKPLHTGCVAQRDSMSTPIINIPQSAILGMHKIEERAVVVNGQIVIRPMMYVALSYDHRIIDGRESVSFLVRVKELLENPELLLFGKDPVKTLLEL